MQNTAAPGEMCIRDSSWNVPQNDFADTPERFVAHIVSEVVVDPLQPIQIQKTNAGWDFLTEQAI